MNFPEDNIFRDIDFTYEELPATDLEQVRFFNCTFSTIAGVLFSDCIFDGCNFSNVAFTNCKLDNVTFKNSKLTGTDFSKARDFGFQISCDNCILDYAILEGKKLNKSTFANCRIQGTDFTQADLSKCKFYQCDFSDAIFMNTNLTGVDFTTSKNFTIDPTLNTVKKAKFLSVDLHGLLTKFDIVVK